MTIGNTITTLDIGTTKLVVTVCRTNESMLTEVIGIASRPFKSLRHGMMTNIDAASETIRQAVEHAELMSGEEIESLVVNISGLSTEGMTSKGIVAIAGASEGRDHKEMRQVDMKDILRAIEMAESVSVGSEKIILHSIPSNFTVDKLKVEEPLGAAGVRLEVDVYLVLCQRAAVENIEKAVSIAGYSVRDITLQSLASAEAVLTLEEKKAGALVIDIGGSQTDVVFYSGDSVRFTQSFEVGSTHISKDLAFGLRTSLQQADEVKLKHGVASAEEVSENDFITVALLSYKKTSRISRKAIAQIIEARVAEIFSLVKESSEKANINDELESGIVLTGAGAMLKGMVEAAEEIFNVPVRLGQPLEIESIDENAFFPGNATSVGLGKLALSRNEESENKEIRPNPQKSSGKLTSMTNYFKKFFN